jgi:hypothetical protein
MLQSGVECLAVSGGSPGTSRSSLRCDGVGIVYHPYSDTPATSTPINMEGYRRREDTSKITVAAIGNLRNGLVEAGDAARDPRLTYLPALCPITVW